MRPAPSVAFGFLLDRQCRLRWAKWYHELAFGPDYAAGKSAEKLQEDLWDSEVVMQSLLPGVIYSEFPDLYPIRKRLLPVVDDNVEAEYYVFALRDDATWQGMVAPLDPELIDRVRRRLGVGDIEPKWYRIAFGAK